MKRPRVRIYRREVLQAVLEATDTSLGRVAANVQGEARRSMRAGGGEARIPSEPGQPPHVQTGTLRAAIQFARVSANRYIVGPTRIAWYGRIHEYGMEVRGRKYPKRPFMRPALERTIHKVMQHFRNLRLDQTPTGRRLNMRRNPR